MNAPNEYFPEDYEPKRFTRRSLLKWGGIGAGALVLGGGLAAILKEMGDAAIAQSEVEIPGPDGVLAKREVIAKALTRNMALGLDKLSFMPYKGFHAEHDKLLIEFNNKKYEVVSDNLPTYGPDRSVSELTNPELEKTVFMLKQVGSNMQPVPYNAKQIKDIIWQREEQSKNGLSILEQPNIKPSTQALS